MESFQEVTINFYRHMFVLSYMYFTFWNFRHRLVRPYVIYLYILFWSVLQVLTVVWWLFQPQLRGLSANPDEHAFCHGTTPLLLVSMTRVLQGVGSQILPHVITRKTRPRDATQWQIYPCNSHVYTPVNSKWTTCAAQAVRMKRWQSTHSQILLPAKSRRCPPIHYSQCPELWSWNLHKHHPLTAGYWRQGPQKTPKTVQWVCTVTTRSLIICVPMCNF